MGEHSSAKQNAQPQVKADEDKAKKPMHGPSSAKIVAETDWESTESKKQFLDNSSDDRCSVEVLEEFIERLQQVTKTIDGCTNLVVMHDEDNRDVLFSMDLTTDGFDKVLEGAKDWSLKLP